MALYLPRLHSKTMGGSDEQTWQTIYRNLLHLLHAKQSEVETLAGERQLLKDRFFRLHDRWLSDVSRLQDKIAEMRAAYAGAGMDRMLLEAKMDLVVAMNRKKAALYKMKSGHAISDLEDLEVVVRHLISKETDYKCKLAELTKEHEKVTCLSGQDVAQHRNLQAEIKKLKHLNEKLSYEKDTELHGLLQERNFVWNQFKKMESDYSHLLKAKRSELELAAQKIAELQQAADKCNLLIKEKDIVIGSLREEINTKEKKLIDYSREISKVSKDHELLKSSNNSPSMQLRTCSQAVSANDNRVKVDTGANLRNGTRNLLSTPDEKKVSSTVSGGGTRRASTRLNERSLQASAGTKALKQGSRKRARFDIPCKYELRGLFSSNFKVPKLKSTQASG